MARSESDSGDSRSSRHRSKRKRHRRSHSRSSSSDRSRSSHSQKSRNHHKSDRREGRRSPKHSRDRASHRSRDRPSPRSRDRSPPRSRDRSPPPLRERSPSRSRDHSKDDSGTRSSKSRIYSDSDPEKSRLPKSLPKSSSAAKAQSGTEDRFGSMSLKEKVSLLAGRTGASGAWANQNHIPTLDQLVDIEEDGFVQHRFSSSAVAVKPKKKNKKAKIRDQPPPKDAAPQLSHESAIFGAVSDTMMALKNSPRLDSKRVQELKSIEDDDVMFGAVFNEDPAVRNKRWIEKLKSIREKLSKDKSSEIPLT